MNDDKAHLELFIASIRCVLDTGNVSPMGREILTNALAVRFGRDFWELWVGGEPYYTLYASHEAAARGGAMLRKPGEREIIHVRVYDGQRRVVKP